MRSDVRRRIAFVSCAAYTGGAEKYIGLLAGGLDRERFEPILVTTGSPGLEPLRSDVRKAGVPVEDTGGISTLFQSLRRIRPDIVHMNMPGPFDCSYGLPASLARLSGVRRIVVTEHLPMVRPFTKARILRSIHMHHVSRFITVSEDNRKHLQYKHGVPSGKIRVVFNGIPDPGPGVDRGKAAAGQIDLLVAGALEERKGHRVIFSAMDRLPGNIRLFIAGEGPMRGEIESLIASGKNEGRVTLLGRVEDVHDMMSRSHIVVVPSLIEATPYVILEAMAAARPVVASDIFGIPEQVEDGVTGILTRPGDDISLADAILHLAADPGMMRRTGEAGRRRYEERFTLSLSVDATEKVYEEIL